jgi:hypothetical protein
MKTNWTRLLALLVIVGCGAVHAQGVRWEDLSLAQREILVDQEANWSELAPERQERIALGATRFLEMNRGERRSAENRFDRWRELTDQRRAAIRESYLTYQRLSPDQRDSLRRTYRNFNRLSPDRRNAIRRQFQDLSGPQRDAIRDRLRDRRVRPAIPR